MLAQRQCEFLAAQVLQGVNGVMDLVKLDFGKPSPAEGLGF